MVKLWIFFVLALSCVCCAAFTFVPTVNGDTSIWLEREGAVAFAASPFSLGLTTPSAETSSFYLFFEYDKNEIVFDMSQMSDNVTDLIYDSVPTGMVIVGEFDGPGTLFDGIRIEGTGPLGLYSGDWIPAYADYLGTISVIPEPMSVFLLSAGFLWMRKRR